MNYGKYLLLTGTDELAVLVGCLAKRLGAAGVVCAVKDEEEAQYAQGLGFKPWLWQTDDAARMLAEFTQDRRFDAVCETAGTAQAYELLMKVAKRGACVALMKPLEQPLYFHVCDVIRDQLHFIGVQSADGESERTAAALRRSGALGDLAASGHRE